MSGLVPCGPLSQPLRFPHNSVLVAAQDSIYSAAQPAPGRSMGRGRGAASSQRTLQEELPTGGCTEAGAQQAMRADPAKT